MWYRAFGLTTADIQPAQLLEHLQRAGHDVHAHFRGDDQGWFEAELSVEDMPVRLNRYLLHEEGIRAQLNTWAGWVETHEQHPQRNFLMQQLISVLQLFSMEVPDTESAEVLGPLCLETSRYLARQTSGYYYIDGQGLFSADDTLLIPE
jgi:hypothetical protein